MSKYTKDCSIKGVAKNFMQIRKDAAVPKPISTGFLIGDYALTKIPVAGKYIKAYNNGHTAGANISHGINAYNESCGHIKKK